MKWKLEQQEKKLDRLFIIVKSVSDEEEQALLSRFLCVRASGFIESSIRNLISEFTLGSSPRQIQSYVRKETKYITNLKYDKIAEVLEMFDSEWKNQFIAMTNDEQKAALNSIVSNRNNIAHGENDSITFAIMKDYYDRVKEVVQILKVIIKK